MALTAVSGCDASLDGPSPAAHGGSTSGAPPDGSDPQASTVAGDPDTLLVEEVLAELGSMADLVTAAAAGTPRLRGPLTALAELHLAHAAALQPDPDAATTTPRPTGTATARSGGTAATRAQVVTLERRLQRRLVDWSVAAASGALARLLASMSAAVAQHVVHHLGGDPAGSTGADPTGGGAG